MNEIDVLQTAALMLICALGGVLSFIVWRVCLWVKGLAKALQNLVDLVARDLELRAGPKERRDARD